GHTLGQPFQTQQPLGSIALLLSSYGELRTGALIRLRREGADGPVVAEGEDHNLFGDSAAIVRFPPQPPGRYFVELSDPRGSVGWWRTLGGSRNLTAYTPDDESPSEVRLDFRMPVNVEEIRKADGLPLLRVLEGRSLHVTLA